MDGSPTGMLERNDPAANLLGEPLPFEAFELQLESST
jgi:hypothetical protein